MKAYVKKNKDSFHIALYMLSILTTAISFAAVLFLLKYSNSEIVYPAVITAIVTIIGILLLIKGVAKETFE